MNATATQLDNREQLLVRMAQSRSLTDDLFRRVRTDALYDRPIPERHRIVFLGGHNGEGNTSTLAGVTQSTQCFVPEGGYHPRGGEAGTYELGTVAYCPQAFACPLPQRQAQEKRSAIREKKRSALSYQL